MVAAVETAWVFEGGFRKMKSEKVNRKELQKEIAKWRIKYIRAERCCNGIGMQQALKKIEELENEAKR